MQLFSFDVRTHLSPATLSQQDLCFIEGSLLLGEQLIGMCFWHMVRVHEHKFLFGVLVYKGRAGVSMVRKKKGGGEEEEEEGYGYI